VGLVCKAVQNKASYYTLPVKYPKINLQDLPFAGQVLPKRPQHLIPTHALNPAQKAVANSPSEGCSPLKGTPLL
jgi:hypothetical protein